jgi:cyclohexyl-isocyanide hydratase
MAPTFAVVFALYPEVTQLDFAGPFEVFSRLPGAEVVLASSRGGEITAEKGLTFANVKRLEDVKACDLLCVPGGFGTIAAMQDPVYIGALRRLATQARFVTSVCSGSLLLGAAGVLQGKRAASHWACREVLAKFGAVPDPSRIVRDGNVITGGGVTAGIDMALSVAAEVAGVDYAETLQLFMEYAPAPPFDSGRPESARPEILRAAREWFDAGRRTAE